MGETTGCGRTYRFVYQLKEPILRRAIAAASVGPAIAALDDERDL